MLPLVYPKPGPKTLYLKWTLSKSVPFHIAPKVDPVTVFVILQEADQIMLLNAPPLPPKVDFQKYCPSFYDMRHLLELSTTKTSFHTLRPHRIGPLASGRCVREGETQPLKVATCILFLILQRILFSTKLQPCLSKSSIIVRHHDLHTEIDLGSFFSQ